MENNGQLVPPTLPQTTSITCLCCVFKHGHVVFVFDDSELGRLAAVEHLKTSHGLIGVSV